MHAVHIANNYGFYDKHLDLTTHAHVTGDTRQKAGRHPCVIYKVSLHKRAQTSIVISVQEVAKCACVGGFGGRAATYRPEVSCIVS